MKINALVICLLATGLLFGQYKPKKKRSDFFGKEQINNRNPGNFAMHLTIGPTFSKAFDNKDQADVLITDSAGNAYKYDITQKGRIGVHIGAGLDYFNKKPGWFSFGRLVDYYELGFRFAYFRGMEKTTLTDANDRDLPTKEGEGKYFSGNLNAHLGIHKIISIPHTKMFLDNGLAFNGTYRLMEADQNYSTLIQPFAKYSPQITAQFNYSLGLGFQLKRGSYLIPSVTIPVFAVEEMGKQSISWFSSRYYPIIAELKWIYRFNRKRSKTGCSTPDKGPNPTPEGAK